ncbi:MAG: sigma-70 family RNA polymerase sigma factor [Polyangiaceae bacterium]
MMEADPLSAMSDAREAFLSLVGALRPELHRYCARMTGSVIEGEDVVQDTLAKAYYALSRMSEAPPLRPWLFRIAHNTALDHLRRYDRKHVDLVAEPPEPAANDDVEIDPALVEAALSVFIGLPPMQRSALVLKDVLGHSLEETAATMGTSVQAVKNALLRARASVVARGATPETARLEPAPDARARLQTYADLFNARDWAGLRAQIGDECRLDLVSRAERRGAGVREYYQRYEALAPGEALQAAVVTLEGRLALGMYRGDLGDKPAYVVLVDWLGDEIRLIRDYRYASYVAREAATPRV